MDGLDPVTLTHVRTRAWRGPCLRLLLQPAGHCSPVRVQASRRRPRSRSRSRSAGQGRERRRGWGRGGGVGAGGAGQPAGAGRPRRGRRCGWGRGGAAARVGQGRWRRRRWGRGGSGGAGVLCEMREGGEGGDKVFFFDKRGDKVTRVWTLGLSLCRLL